MSGKRTIKLMLLGLSAGLAPCIALAVDMPANPLSEQVDPTHLGEVQEGVTARAQGDWTVQVGAFADEDKAEAALEKLAADRPASLGRAARLITPIQWDNSQTLYRARFGGLTLEAAAALCASLNGVGQACFLAEAERTKPVLREAAMVPVTDDMRGTGLEPALKDAPATLEAPTAALREALVAVPQLKTIVERPAKSRAPNLVALNDNLSSDKAGRVSNAELSGMRGGFFTAAGAQFDFGASVKTMINGQLALQTNLTWTPQGAAITSLAGLGQQISSQVQSQLAKAGIGAGNNTNTAKTQSTPVSNSASTPANLASSIAQPAASLAADTASGALNTAQNALNSKPAVQPAIASTPQTVTIPTSAVTGITVPGGAGGGSTTVLANIGANQIQNIILNSASNQNINQNTNVTLTIYNLQQWQQQLAQHAISSQLAGEIMAVSGLGH